MNTLVRLPWFRVHIILLNDPGRLISVHLMHTGLVSGWSGCMALYEIIIVDASDPVYNPLWRQGSYVIPFMCRLGVARSLYSWFLGLKLSFYKSWTYETVDLSHITLSGLCVLAGFWHWSYWDLDLFISIASGQLVLDLSQILGIHLFIAAYSSFGFGLGHLCGGSGPGLWTSDSFGVISSNHIVAGWYGLILGLWHVSSRPGKAIYKLLGMGNLEEVLSSSIDPELYDYIGCVPSKGDLFRGGAILKGDGLIQDWCGHPVFEIGTLSLAVRRMPGFFETFPCILIDQGGTVRADIPFRRAESRYSIEQSNVVVSFGGGILNGTEYSSPSLVKGYARKAQFGEIFVFDKKTASADGVFRSSARGWYSSRAVFQDLWTGLKVTAESLAQVEYGRNEKLGYYEN